MGNILNIIIFPNVVVHNIDIYAEDRITTKVLNLLFLFLS